MGTSRLKGDEIMKLEVGMYVRYKRANGTNEL